jgi:hypothetical protein
MKDLPSITAIGISVLLFSNAQAFAFLTEQFGGYNDGRVGDTCTGGGSTIPGWYTPQNGITLTNALGSLDAEGAGLVAAYGAKVQVSNAGITNLQGVYNKFVNAGTFPPGTDTNIYYSFLYKFNNLADVPTGNATRIIGVNRQNSGVTADLTFHWWLTASNTGSAIQIGINKYLGTTNFATTNISAGETVLIVVRQRVINGTGNDVEELWINPPTNTFGRDEGSVPPVAASASDGTEDTSTAGPGRFHIVQWVNAEFDELRIAASWAEVTIPRGSYISAYIASSPTNVTQVEGIGATFRSSAGNTTSPSYQWQISQNGTGTWTNIPGGVGLIYVTPNLYEGYADQGNRYRMIVTSGGDYSTATSTVATVTLTNPIFTASGVIVHDQFTDGVRHLPPVVTQSNSVWFTSLAAATNLNASTGDLVGVPLSGSSSLWLGFFTEANAPPVHVGPSVPERQIKVTLPFIPNAFDSHTNNGSLRFGLFDYYDGGLRPTADATTLTGSGGQGFSVRGYMLSVDFGTNFTANTPLSLLVRTGLEDSNLMGTTADYEILASGPAGGGYANAPSFVAGTRYTLEFSVKFTWPNSSLVTATISGGGTNWTCTAVDTNRAYHRFDAFAIRLHSLEASADSFTFPEFKVELYSDPAPCPYCFRISNCWYLSPTQFALEWESFSNISYQVQSRPSLTSGHWITNDTVLATGRLTTYTNDQAAGAQNFYRIMIPFPQPEL